MVNRKSTSHFYKKCVFVQTLDKRGECKNQHAEKEHPVSAVNVRKGACRQFEEDAGYGRSANDKPDGLWTCSQRQRKERQKGGSCHGITHPGKKAHGTEGNKR
ncbi:MAG: hypothetical protein BROFUL_01640 [Candidatus Brocadia fulgida]|uniref:Uncharacterized protein n=1 Tax=Candidatus Brocadia fulgida TaxID=380242 RepID=A0A0M2UUC4_9BACT|nr:MAG: hypothetical protein BROFUL_01640 [Candidatus Brocadia fulgida]